MTTAENDRGIDSIEFIVSDLERSRGFYGKIFGWTFKDYGPYLEFNDGRLSGGFTNRGTPRPGGPLVIIYAVDLAAIKQRVEEIGATIVEHNLEFPGGRRFHFLDPDGYDLAVWSDR